MRWARIRRQALWAALVMAALQGAVWMHRVGMVEVGPLRPFVWLFAIDMHDAALPTPWTQVNHILLSFLVPWLAVVALLALAELCWVRRPRRKPLPASIPLQPDVLLKLGARLLLGLTALALTLVQLFNWSDSASLMQYHGVTTGTEAVMSGLFIVQLLGAIMLMTGWRLRLGAWICLLWTLPSVLSHPFWSFSAAKFEAALLALLAQLGLMAGFMLLLAMTAPKKPAAPAGPPKPAAPAPKPAAAAAH